MSADFVTWLQSEMGKRGLSQSELARRGGFTPTAINKVLSRERMPGLDFCKGIARAFGMRDVDVMQIAGLAQNIQIDDEPPNVRSLVGKFKNLTDEDQATVLKLVTALEEMESAQRRRIGRSSPKVR